MGRKTRAIAVGAVVGAAALLSCSDDRWEGDVFRWPPLARTVEHGELRLIPGQGSVDKVLVRLDGSHYQAGFAHGRLLGMYIVRLLEEYLIPLFPPDTYREFHDGVDEWYVWDPRYQDELQGMVDGMRAEGVDLRLEAFDRELDARDLMIWNTLGEWDGKIPPEGPGSETFAAWGAETEGRFPVVARNFGTYRDQQQLLGYQWVLFVHHAQGFPVLSVAPPGFIGVITGVNQRGLAVFANGADGNVGGPLPGVPTALWLRDYLISTEPAPGCSAQLEDWLRLNPRRDSWSVLGFSINEMGHGYAWVVECDPNFVRTRYAGDVWPTGKPEAIFMARTLRQPGGRPPASDDDYERLVAVYNDVKGAGRFDPGECFKVIQRTAGGDVFGYNVHSVMLYRGDGGPELLVAVPRYDERAAEAGVTHIPWPAIWK